MAPSGRNTVQAPNVTVADEETLEENEESGKEESDIELETFANDVAFKLYDDVLDEADNAVTEYALYGIYIDPSIPPDCKDSEAIFNAELFDKFKTTLTHLTDVNFSRIYTQTLLKKDKPAAAANFTKQESSDEDNLKYCEVQIDNTDGFDPPQQYKIPSPKRILQENNSNLHAEDDDDDDGGGGGDYDEDYYNNGHKDKKQCTLRLVNGTIGYQKQEDGLVVKTVQSSKVSGSVFEILGSLGYRIYKSASVRAYEFHKDFGNLNHIKVSVSSHSRLPIATTFGTVAPGTPLPGILSMPTSPMAASGKNDSEGGNEWPQAQKLLVEIKAFGTREHGFPKQLVKDFSRLIANFVRF